MGITHSRLAGSLKKRRGEPREGAGGGFGAKKWRNDRAPAATSACPRMTLALPLSSQSKANHGFFCVRTNPGSCCSRPYRPN